MIVSCSLVIPKMEHHHNDHLEGKGSGEFYCLFFPVGSSVCLSHIVDMDITLNQTRKIIKTHLCRLIIHAGLFQIGLGHLVCLEVS